MDLVSIRKFTQPRIWYRVEKVGTADLWGVEGFKRFGNKSLQKIIEFFPFGDVELKRTKKA